MPEIENSNDAPSYTEMEELFVNNAKLERIEAYLKRFNPIKTMKMERMEIRHSAILSWILDPSETHGLGDRFLKAFLGKALAGYNQETPTALDISQSDLRDAEIRCEWQNIDIFILSPSNNWGFIVENKFGSKQRKGQLDDYAKKMRSYFSEGKEDLKIRGIFLTLHDEEAEDALIQYAPIKYEDICEILERQLSQHGSLFSSEVTIFLTHYLDILKDATGMSEELNEMELLARQLYRDHKKVLDFVIEHGASTDFAIAVRTLFGENPAPMSEVSIGKGIYCFSGLDNKNVSFLPLSWFEAFDKGKYNWAGCQKWWARYPLIVWFHISNTDEGDKGKLTLFAEVGPFAYRKELIEAIQDIGKVKALNNINFQKGATTDGRKYSKFLKNNSVSIKDVHDPEAISLAMITLLDKFQSEFEVVAEVLPQFVKYGEVKIL